MKISAPGLSLATAAPTTSAVGDVAALGTGVLAARDNHLHGREAFAVPAVVLGTAAAAGVAATLLRSDGTIAAFDATAPVTQAYGDAAAVGVVALAARRDHRHGMPKGWTVVDSGSLTSVSTKNITALSGRKRYRLRLHIAQDANTSTTFGPLTAFVNSDQAGPYRGVRMQVIDATVTGVSDAGSAVLTLMAAATHVAEKFTVEVLLEVEIDTVAANPITVLWSVGTVGNSTAASRVHATGVGHFSTAAASITAIGLDWVNAFSGTYILEGNND